MPFCSPRSSSGKTSGLSRLNMRNISAVQRPMPRTATSSVMISSSAICGQRCTWIEPLAKCCARSAMYSVLRSDSPQARNCGRGRASTPCGVISPTQATRRFHTLCAALTEICWPTMARASVKNGSPRGARKTFPSARLARSQYSGFMQRQVGKEVLRLHAHRPFLICRKREINRAARHVAAHRMRVLELERKERKDALHAPVLKLGARPQLVQDRGRFGVKAHMPRPVRLVDAANRLHAHRDAEEVVHPQRDDGRQGVERCASIAQADHRVVARVTLPVDRRISAVQDIELDLTQGAARLDDQPPDAAVAVAGGMQLHGLAIGEQRMPFLDGGLLLAKEKLRRAQLQGIVAALQDVAQDDVHQLLDE